MRIAAALLGALLLLTLWGCSAKQTLTDPPISGGTTDKTDPNAPKTIESTEIESLSAVFCLLGEWTPGREDVNYRFEVAKGADGALTARVDPLGLSAPADEALLASLQKVIADNALASRNGEYRVTAGLAPGYQECSLAVTYASGETLSFTVNNDPDASWSREMYLIFADWFASQGDDSLVPPRRTGPVTSVTLEFSDGGRTAEYRAVEAQEKDAIEGERHLFRRRISDDESGKVISADHARFPADFEQNVAAILDRFDLRPFDTWSVLYGEGRAMENEDVVPPVLQLHIVYEDGARMNIDSGDERDVELLRPLLAELTSYFDTLFED